MEYKEQKITNENGNKTESKKKGDSVRGLWENFRHTNIHIMGVLEGKYRQLEIGNLFEKLMTENFPDFVKKIDIQVQEAQRVPNKMNAKRPIPRHNLIRMPKVKDKES